MEKEFYARFPTILGLCTTKEALGGIPATGREKTDKQTSFVLKYYSYAVKAGKLFGVHPLVILAQASIESGWGTSPLAMQGNNFFGITAYGNPNQFWKGAVYTSKTSGFKFRVYPSIEASFADFARLIATYYKEAAQLSNNVNAYAQKISQSKYISETGGDNREKYRALIIQSANTILAIAKKKLQIQHN